jgi:branched-chain amino acid transport system permease protein
VFVALFFFFRGTMLGRAVRSVIQDEEGARLVGIDPKRMRTLILVLSGVLVALVAVSRSMTIPVTVTSGISLTIFALIVTVVGGLGSVAGAFLAGLLLGIINAVSSFYIGTFLTFIILLGAAAFTILLRPSGLLGVPE